MNVKLSKEINRMVKNFALAYPELKGATNAFEKWRSVNGKVDEMREGEYFLRIGHIKLIEETFKEAVKPEHQKKVWSYFYGKEKPEAFEKTIFDEEIKKWLYCIAKEIGLTPNF